MSFWKRFGQQEKRLGAVLLLAGFLAGIACVCFFPGLFVQNPGFLDTDTLSGISEWNMNRTGLFLYCLQKRLGMALLLVLLALSGAGMICLIVLAAGSGLADDPDGAVAALWNPGELLFPGGAGSTTGGAGSGLLYAAGMVPAQKSCVGRVDFPGGDWNRLCGGRVCQSIHFKSRDASVLGIGDTKCQIKIWWNWYFPYRYLVLPENMPKNRLKMRKFQHCFSEIHCI